MVEGGYVLGMAAFWNAEFAAAKDHLAEVGYDPQTLQRLKAEGVY